jgi:eukaryotic-like serine/threonine-protein kinase
MSTPPGDSPGPGVAGQQEVFGPYLVFDRLGVGGMATVHRAREHGIEGFERIVALKRLLPHLAEDASFVRSFVREAKLASLLRHANIVQLYELGRVNTTYFISMEYIDGRDIRRILRQGRKVTGPPTVNVTVALLIQLSDALDYAHTRCDDDSGEPLHIVHRDVSPSNLLVTKSGHLKVIDFGIAKAQSSQLRTATGRVKGKLAYMAPEAIAGKELDARSDVFSAGVIAHELLTARPLFASKNEYQTLLKVQKGDILPPSTFNQACPPELDAIVLKALARDPERRWASAAQMRDALHEVRIRYHLSATNREVASWCEWAFSMEAPGNNFSGPMVTDSLGGVPSQSRSPLPMPMPPTELAPVDAVPRLANTPLPDRPLARSGSEDDEAADVAWGGGQEHDSDQPVVLDEVPDHSRRAPSVAGALAAAAAEPARADWQRTLIGGAPAPRGATVTPAEFPYGSSNDALAGRTRRASSQPGYAPGADTDEAPRVDASSFGAGLLDRGPSHTTRNLIVGALIAAIVGVVLLITVGRGGDREPTVTASPAPITGKLRFIVEPKDAVVRIAGIEPHTGSDWSVELEAGVFQVEISRDGYKSWVTQIELSPGDSQTVRVVLEQGGNPNVATLVIRSTPAGLTVLLDGQEIGQTPLTREVPPGPHTVALRSGGEIRWRESFQAQANTKFEFAPDMSETKQRERAARDARVAVVPERRPPRPVAAPAPAASAPPPAPAEAKAPAPAPAEPPPAPAITDSARTAEPPRAEPPRAEPPRAEPPPAAPAPSRPSPPQASGPVTVPPSAVKRVSGELGTVRAVIRPDEQVPATIAVKICIDPTGKVASINVLTKISPDLKNRLVSAIRGFRYAPYRQGGVAVPACFAETFRPR